MPLPPLVEAMLDPAFYPRRPAAVELRQTHISYVLLAGDEVFKLKKPVRFTFLDFSSLERRRFFCHEEVRLNRRLAPDVYRGVVGVRPRGTGYELCDADDPGAVEYAVHMRRLDDERTLARALERGDVGVGMIDRLASQLVDFHRRADGGEEVRSHGDTTAILRVLEDNFEGVRPFRGRTLAVEDDDAIQRFARGFLAREVELFRRRQNQGRIREGHGDLRCDHIYLDEPPRIVDCVEFSPRFRCCDVASDLAFLVMDLHMRGREDLAARLAARYAEIAGDAELSRLLPFYACYRAYVRGKVGSLTSAEEEVAADERTRAAESARRFFALALRLTWAYEHVLVAVTGLSGSGKSTVARRLAERTGIAHVSTDVVR
jgi:aminoglycoside phosphotransferase family enzyme